MNTTSNLIVNVGRLNPMHLGHEAVIDSSLNWFRGEFLQILWSANASFSLRHFFTYAERREFFKKVYPNIPVVWIPDFKTDEEWLVALDDLLMSHFWLSSREDVKQKVTFLWWCEEDVWFFVDDWRKVNIVNRFDWSTPKISATEVRDALIHSRDLEQLLNNKLVDDVRNLFNAKWELFRKI